MKKTYALLLAIFMCVFSTFTSFAANANEVAFQATNEIISEMQNDLAKEEVERLTGSTDSQIDFSYVVPVYITGNVTSQSKSILDTLEFTGEYRVPVVNTSGEGIGMFTVAKQSEHWSICSYHAPYDFLTYMRSASQEVSCLVEIPQLGNDFGFLKIKDGVEDYCSILNEQVTYSGDQSQTLLTQIIKETNSGNEDVDGGGNSVSNPSGIYWGYGVLIVFVAALLTFFVIKRPKNKTK